MPVPELNGILTGDEDVVAGEVYLALDGHCTSAVDQGLCKRRRSGYIPNAAITSAPMTTLDSDPQPRVVRV